MPVERLASRLHQLLFLLEADKTVPNGKQRLLLAATELSASSTELLPEWHEMHVAA